MRTPGPFRNAAITSAIKRHYSIVSAIALSHGRPIASRVPQPEEYFRQRFEIPFTWFAPPKVLRASAIRNWHPRNPNNHAQNPLTGRNIRPSSPSATFLNCVNPIQSISTYRDHHRISVHHH